MKKKRLFKNNLQMIVYTIIFIICLVLFVVIGKTDFHKESPTEAIKFSSIYSRVPEDNLYVFADHNKVLEILNSKRGILLMGFPSNKWTNYYAEILNQAAKDLGITEIYYYDFLKDREESNGTYETIVNKLSEYVPVNDEDFQDLQAPTVVMVKDGKVYAYLDETSIIKGNKSPESYYTVEKRQETYDNMTQILTSYLGE